MKFNYFLYNPSGNITALVSDAVAGSLQYTVAAEIMKKEPTCEQVGFLASSDDSDIMVAMAGGEFCGNATLCAAACFAGTHGAVPGMSHPVRVRCSGCPEPISASFVPYDSTMGIASMEADFDAIINSFHGFKAVHMPGITHIIADGSQIDTSEAESCIRDWTEELDVPALGIMLLDRTSESLTPLVYVRGSDTLFWEQSCASGTCAVALAEGECRLFLRQPGGLLRVQNHNGKIKLTNKIVMERIGEICIPEQNL